MLRVDGEYFFRCECLAIKYRTASHAELWGRYGYDRRGGVVRAAPSQVMRWALHAGQGMLDGFSGTEFSVNVQ